jgi:signal transduction histidine kinase
VRYISHELRTPLNAVFVGNHNSQLFFLLHTYSTELKHFVSLVSLISSLLLLFQFNIPTMELIFRVDHTAGLKLLTDDLFLLQQSSDNPIDADRYDTICDVNSANRTALDILNDLLCFDKLESGILEVHKHEVSVLPFITDCVGMFSCQARENGVNFVIRTDRAEDSEVPTQNTNFNCSALTEGDTVFMDRFKMDQVLRNLVSNALKFTPRGGTIKINATFVPNIDKVEDVSVKPKKWVDLSSLLHFYPFGTARSSTSRVHVTDSCQDLETGAYKIGGVDSDHGRKNESNTNPTNNDTNNDMDDNGKNGTTPGKLVIVVTDSGVGLSDMDQKRLFKEVVQFKPELLQAGGGSGLGLWITNNIVRMHDGKVSVYSAGDGMGCSFTVEVGMERKVRTASPLVTPPITPITPTSKVFLSS